MNQKKVKSKKYLKHPDYYTLFKFFIQGVYFKPFKNIIQMKQFEYKEMIMSNKITLIDQINEQGRYGWEFVIQAQRMTPNKFSVNGQPIIDFVLIYKREIYTPEVIQN